MNEVLGIIKGTAEAMKIIEQVIHESEIKSQRENNIRFHKYIDQEIGTEVFQWRDWNKAQIASPYREFK
jgi:hypothetical protein